MINHKKHLCIQGETLELLKQLLRDGYIYNGKNRNKLRFLQKIFPVIRCSLLFPWYIFASDVLSAQKITILHKK